MITTHQEPKYGVNADGNHYNRLTGKVVPAHVPRMLLLATDALAADNAIAPYVAAARQLGLEHVAASAQERLDVFRNFAVNHPSEMGNPSNGSLAVYPDRVGTPPEPEGAPNAFEIVERPYLYRLSGGNVIQFVQPAAASDGAAPPVLLPGTTTEEVLAMLIDRVSAQNEKQPCDENADILLHLTAARTRQLDRMGANKATLAPGVVEQFGIAMIPCTSANLEAFGYRHADNTLALRFRGGRIYHYKDVPAHVYQGLLDAESKGGYAAREITGKYEGVRQDVPATA